MRSATEFDEASAPVPLAAMRARIDRLAALGTAMIYLSGGEPFLHPDLDDIVRRIRSHDIFAGLMKHQMISAVFAAIVFVTIVAPTAAAPNADIAMYLQQNAPRPGCRPSGDIVRLNRLPEASGVAASRRTPGVLWAHNDSGEPLVFALNEQGAVTGRVRVTGARVEDWEDIAVGPCAQGSCLYIADVGDNSGNRDHVTVYRVPEPSPQDSSTAPAEVFRARYAGGAYDAEALFVTPE
jgi:hypothetical protein